MNHWLRLNHILMLIVLALAILASACTTPTAPTDWRIATGAGAAPKGSTLPVPGEFETVKQP